MVQARPRAPPSPTTRHPTTIPTTAADVRASNRKRLREIASSASRETRRTSGPEASSVPEDASPSGGSTLPKRTSSAAAPPKLEEPSPAVAVDVAAAAAPSTGPLELRANSVGGDVHDDLHGDDESQNVRETDMSLSGGTENVDKRIGSPEKEEEREEGEEEEAAIVSEERSRETMVYQGNVRSGQQVSRCAIGQWVCGRLEDESEGGGVYS